jgi:hypothetical protein
LEGPFFEPCSLALRQAGTARGLGALGAPRLAAPLLSGRGATSVAARPLSLPAGWCRGGVALEQPPDAVRGSWLNRQRAQGPAGEEGPPRKLRGLVAVRGWFPR